MTEAPPRGRMYGALICLVVVVFQLYAAHGFEHVLDLNVTDDCFYLSNGRSLFEGSPDWHSLAAWSGPYHVLYGLLDFADLGLSTPDVMCVLLALASSLALLWALSGVVSLEAAAGGALLWASGSAYVSGMNGVYVCGATLLFLAAALLARGREVLGATLACVAAATRPEILLWVVSAGLIAAFLGRRAAGSAVAVVAVALLVFQLAADDRDRAGLAFRQHYALGAAEHMLLERGSVSSAEDVPVYAFNHPERWVRESFGSATSLPGALAANPQEVGRHVLRNLRGLADLIIPLAGRFPGSAVARRGVGVVLSVLAALGLIELLYTIRRGRTLDSPGSTWMTALVLAAPMLAATSILYGPRLAYVIGGFLPLVLLAVRGMRRLASLRVFQRLGDPGAGTAGRIIPVRSERGVLGLAALLVAAVAVPRPFDGLPHWSLKWRKILAAAEREGGHFAVLGEPYRASVLLPPGDRVFGMRNGIPEGVNRVLLHATDLSKYRGGALPRDEDGQVRRVLEGGEWRLQRYSDEVLLIVRNGA